MSLSYADKLSYREDLGGSLGSPELFDSEDELRRKVKELAILVRAARKIVAFTGAGISTSCGIPDFRGPSGIWTLQRAGKPLPKPKVSFALAKPSFTHGALASLMKYPTGKLAYVVSQNVDGLHLRSGIPRHRLAELHGNSFAERCPQCRREYIRDFEIESVGFKETPRTCLDCKCFLRDHCLDWEDALPEDELRDAEKHSRESDLAICLGTSLQISPACNLPLRTIRTYTSCKEKTEPGKLVIINLQKTQHDKKAVTSGGAVIRAKADDVMRMLMKELDIPVGAYARKDMVNYEWKQGKRGIIVSVWSRHGASWPLPFLQFIRVRITNDRDEDTVVEAHKHPFKVEYEGGDVKRMVLELWLEGEDRPILKDVEIGPSKALVGKCLEWEFVSQVVQYDVEKAEDENGNRGKRHKKNVNQAGGTSSSSSHSL